MKKLVAVLLTLALCCSLSACGSPAEVSEHSANSEPAANPLQEAALGITESDKVAVSTEWTELSLIDNQYGYLIHQADLAALELDSGLPCYRRTETRVEGDQLRLQLLCIDGTVLEEAVLPVPTNDEAQITNFYITDSGCWVMRRIWHTEDADDGQWYGEFTLEFWDNAQNCLVSMPIDENFGLGESGLSYAGIHAAPDGTPLVKTEQALYWLDDQANVIATLPMDGICSLCASADGTLYLYKESGAIYPIDWDSHTLMEPLFTPRYDENLCSGSLGYDFFLVSNQTLRGLKFSEGTVTELVNWTDCDMGGMVYGVSMLDENTLLVQAGDYLLMERVPVEELPEKTVVHMAYGLGEGLRGFTWQQTSGGLLEQDISTFNLTNGTYRVEVKEFVDTTDLNLLFAAGDIPDLIYWNYNDATALHSYGKKGYLADLTAYMDADPELNVSDLMPNILAGCQNPDGSIYQLPVSFTTWSLRGSRDYVGTEPGMRFSQLYDLAQTLPEDMMIYSADRHTALWMFLEPALGNFIDLDAGTCDFHNGEFESLLLLCRDFFPLEYDSTNTSASLYEIEGLVSGEILLQWDSYHTGGAFYAADSLPEYEAAGILSIGYPGVGGNGTVIRTNATYSICEDAPQGAGAWEFLRTLLDYDTQVDRAFFHYSVFTDAFLAGQKQLQQTDCPSTDEALEAANEIVMNAVMPTLMDNDLLAIVLEESNAFLDGLRDFSTTADILESRITIYLSEQS